MPEITDTPEQSYLPKPNPAAVAQRAKADGPGLAAFVEVMTRNPVGAWMDNKFEQAQHFRGIIYLAVMAKAEAMAGATAKVSRRKRVGASEEDAEEYAEHESKSFRTFLKSAGASDSQSHGDDDEFSPLPWDHPAAKLMEDINPRDTWADWITQWVIQEELTGVVYNYKQPNRAGNVSALWPIPTAMTSYIPMDTGAYPSGGIRVNNTGMYQVGFLPAMTCNIAGEDLLVYRKHGSLYRQDGYSPLTACGRQIDTHESIDESRKSAMDHGVNPDLFVAIQGASQEQLTEFVNKVNSSAGGSKNAHKTVAVDGENIKILSQNTSAKDMDYTQGWEQLTKVCSAIFGVTPAIMGLTESSSYAEFYAQLKQFYTQRLVPALKRISAFLNKHLFHPEFGDDIYCELVAPKIDDAELRLRELSAAPSDLWTANEARAQLNLKPWSDGDQPLSIVMARRNAAIQQQQAEEQQQKQAAMMQQQPQAGMGGDPAQAGAPPAPPGADPSQEAAGDSDPSAMIDGSLLSSLGIDGSQGDASPEAKAIVRKALDAYAKAMSWTIGNSPNGKRYVYPSGNPDPKRRVYGAQAEAIIARMGAADAGGNVYEEGDNRTHHGPANYLGGAHGMKMPAKPATVLPTEPKEKNPGSPPLGTPPTTPGKQPVNPAVPANEPAKNPGAPAGTPNPAPSYGDKVTDAITGGVGPPKPGTPGYAPEHLANDGEAKPATVKPPANQGELLSKIDKASRAQRLASPLNNGLTNVADMTLPEHFQDVFDAHGTDGLKNLASLLNDGISDEKSNGKFFSGVLPGSGGKDHGDVRNAGVGIKEGDFVVLSHPGKTLKGSGIAAVAVGPRYASQIPELEKAFPGVKFLSGASHKGTFPHLESRNDEYVNDLTKIFGKGPHKKVDYSKPQGDNPAGNKPAGNGAPQPGTGKQPATAGASQPSDTKPAGYLGEGVEPRSGGHVVEGVKKDGSKFHQEITSASSDEDAAEMAKLLGAHTITKINGKARGHAEAAVPKLAQAIPKIVATLKQPEMAKLLPQLQQPKSFAERFADAHHGVIASALGLSPKDAHSLARNLAEGFARGLLNRLAGQQIIGPHGFNRPQRPETEEEKEAKRLGSQALKLGAQEEKTRGKRAKEARAKPLHESRTRIRDLQLQIAEHRQGGGAKAERQHLHDALMKEQRNWHDLKTKHGTKPQPLTKAIRFDVGETEEIAMYFAKMLADLK